jgi:hypothetical protein
MKLGHCGRCGCKIEGKKYNPYNETFGNYARSNNEQMFCRKCAEIFVNERNKCKGGHWILEHEQSKEDELRDIALDFKKRLG